MPNAPASDWERDYYGSNRERLRQVKAKYDPGNVFSFEQSVAGHPLIRFQDLGQFSKEISKKLERWRLLASRCKDQPFTPGSGEHCAPQANDCPASTPDKSFGDETGDSGHRDLGEDNGRAPSICL